MSAIKNTLIFAVGAGIGAFTAWYLVKDKYATISEQEIKEIKEYYDEKLAAQKEAMDDLKDEVMALRNADNEPVEKKEPVRIPDKPDPKVLVENIIHDSGYAPKPDQKTNYTKYSSAEREEEQKEELPYVISDEEFGEIDDYERRSFTYYINDDILVDDSDGDTVIDDVVDVIGPNTLEHFEKDEVDVLYVRNDKLQADYEIALDVGSYF